VEGSYKKEGKSKYIDVFEKYMKTMNTNNWSDFADKVLQNDK
jgi:hypothetical protein